MDFLKKVADKERRKWTMEIVKLFPEYLLEENIRKIINNQNHEDLLNKRNDMGFKNINGFLNKFNELLDSLFEKNESLKKTEEYYIYCILKKNYSIFKNKWNFLFFRNKKYI